MLYAPRPDNMIALKQALSAEISAQADAWYAAFKAEIDALLTEFNDPLLRFIKYGI